MSSAAPKKPCGEEGPSNSSGCLEKGNVHVGGQGPKVSKRLVFRRMIPGLCGFNAGEADKCDTLDGPTTRQVFCQVAFHDEFGTMRIQCRTSCGRVGFHLLGILHSDMGNKISGHHSSPR